MRYLNCSTEKFIDMEAGQDLDTRGLIVAAVLIIFFSLLWFTFSFVLRRRSANNDQVDTVSFFFLLI